MNNIYILIVIIINCGGMAMVKVEDDLSPKRFKLSL